MSLLQVMQYHIGINVIKIINYLPYLGGYYQSSLTSVEIFSLESRQWTSGPEMLRPLHYGLLVQWSQNEILIVGGINQSDQKLETIYKYDHKLFLWSEMPQRLSKRRAYLDGIIIRNDLNFC